MRRRRARTSSPRRSGTAPREATPPRPRPARSRAGTRAARSPDATPAPCPDATTHIRRERRAAATVCATMPTVARFNVTPVKSTALHHPDHIRVERSGAVGNRDFFFLDEDGKLFGGSKLGPLVRIHADHDASTDTLRLRFPDGVDVQGP